MTVGSPTFTTRQHFTPSPSTVTEARWFVCQAIERAGWDGAVLSSAELVASELAANAVMHARTPYEVRVEVGEEVRIEVADSSPSMPVLREPDLHALGGRGLLLVDQVSSDWGAERTTEGKCVWSVIGADAARWWHRTTET